ncbi:uncharacterized protein TNCV_3949501 [Trichonephila clavipes]|nr:uncharacterized protein TNCV_3949501 [Trichonephila clavipes]
MGVVAISSSESNDFFPLLSLQVDGAMTDQKVWGFSFQPESSMLVDYNPRPMDSYAHPSSRKSSREAGKRGGEVGGPWPPPGCPPSKLGLKRVKSYSHMYGANDRCHFALCDDEFRGPRSGLCRSEGLSIHQCAQKIRALQTVLEAKREEFVDDSFKYAKSLCEELNISFELPRRIRRKHIFGNESKDVRLSYEDDLRRTIFSSID